MIINKDNFDQYALDNFTALPNEISIKEGNGYLTIDDFNEVTHSEEAKNSKNIIYIWRTKKNIPRLKGESNIVYIGQTSKSFFKRHGSANIKVNSKANKQKYNDIVQMYGAIDISYIKLINFDPSASLLKVEGQFLWWYFLNHSEYPPVNYTKTKVRNDTVQLIV
jgi:hypothetical protein